MLDRAGPRGVRHSHLQPERRNEWELMLQQFRPLFVCIRHPYTTALSWARKGRPISELPERWTLLTELVDRAEPYYIVIDIDRKQEILDGVQQELDIPLDPDNWQPVGAAPPESYIELNAAGRDLVQSTLNKQPEFWGRWYSLDR